MVVKLVCDWCGMKFIRIAPPSSLKYKSHYCSKHCAMVAAREKFRPEQGVVLTNSGHLMSREPNHPNHNANNQVPYAHLVMEMYIGRYLKPKEVVHHKDGDPLNNHISNLELMTLGEHVTLHNNMKVRNTNGQFIKNVP